MSTLTRSHSGARPQPSSAPCHRCIPLHPTANARARSSLSVVVLSSEQHNLFCQVRGRKSFLLFPPDAAPLLRTYPIHHWSDRRARLDVEQLGTVEGEALKGCAVEAELVPGDTLFLPSYWFHHVHALDGEGVSLSLWYQHNASLAEAVRKDAGRDGKWAHGTTRHSVRVRMAREAEEVVGAAIGPRHVRTFFLRLSWFIDRPYPCATCAYAPGAQPPNPPCLPRPALAPLACIVAP